MSRLSSRPEEPNGSRALPARERAPGTSSCEAVHSDLRVRSGPPFLGAVAALAMTVVLIGGVVVTRGASAIPSSPDVSPRAAGAGAAGVSLTAAAAAFDAATVKGGSGFTWTVVSRSTVYAKPDGPLIEVPDPADPHKVGGTAESYYAGASLERGTATPDGAWLEMRAGPSTPDAAPDFATAPVTMSALRTGGIAYRNDGDGWYVSDATPGIGLDLVSVGLLSRMLRDATDVSAGVATTVDGKPATAVTATAALVDLPGILAVDAASFSQFAAPLDLTFDASGRLVRLHAQVRNTRVTTFDLITDVTITFDFVTPTGPLPDPLPAAPSPSPALGQ